MSSSKKYCNILLISLSWLLIFSQTLFAQNWDTRILRSINRQYSPSVAPWVNRYENSVIFLVVGVPASLIIYGNLSNRMQYRNQGLQLATSTFLAYMTVYGLKKAVNRKRPYERYDWVRHDLVEEDRSFPSGHMAGSATLTAFLWTQPKVSKYIKMGALIWSVGVGVGRMYQGVHYPTDIIGGALIGVGSVFLIRHFFNFQSKVRLFRFPVILYPEISGHQLSLNLHFQL